MTLKSTLEKLTQVQAAIDAIETGAQEYWIGDRRLTRADLDDLYRREERLEVKLSRENRGGIRVRGVVIE